MKLRTSSLHLAAAAALLLLGACSGDEPKKGSGNGGGAAGSTGAAGASSSGAAGTSTLSGTAGSTTGAAGSTTGTAGSTTGAAGGTAGTTGAAGVTTGAAGSTAGTAGATTGAAGSVGPTGDAGVSDTDPPPPRPINVMPGGTYKASFNGQQLYLDKSKPIMGKLILYLGSICGDTGAGGIDSFVNQYGFHTFAPKTQTCVNGGNVPQKYKDALQKDPNDAEANRQVGDARMELWDGVDRVDWVTVAKGSSIVEETVAALNSAKVMDPGGDWGFFLNADGTLRTTDVWVVGYSWGSQSWGMISSYVRFGRVICTSGPQAEGFPNGTWITHPSATPNDRKYTLLGFNDPYPSTDKLDTAPNTVTSMIDTTTKAGWLGPPINVKPGDTGPFTVGHQIAMVGQNAHSPGGHTIFCTGDSMNGWTTLCKYVFDVK
jgi:hypothetical protein